MDKLSYALGIGIGTQLRGMQGCQGCRRGLFGRECKERQYSCAAFRTPIRGYQRRKWQEAKRNKQGEVPLRGYAHRRNQVRQFVRPWRTGYVWAEPGNRRLDRRLATYERRSQISLLHTLQLRLRRTWRRCFNTSIRSIGV